MLCMLSLRSEEVFGSVPPREDFSPVIRHRDSRGVAEQAVLVKDGHDHGVVRLDEEVFGVEDSHLEEGSFVAGGYEYSIQPRGLGGVGGGPVPRVGHLISVFVLPQVDQVELGDQCVVDLCGGGGVNVSSVQRFWCS